MRESRKNLQDLDWYFGTSESAQFFKVINFQKKKVSLFIIEKVWMI